MSLDAMDISPCHPQKCRGVKSGCVFLMGHMISCMLAVCMCLLFVTNANIVIDDSKIESEWYFCYTEAQLQPEQTFANFFL